MDYSVRGNDIYLKQSDFDLDETLDCGQAFRWEKISRNTYSGAFFNTPLVISGTSEKDVFCLHDTTEDELLNIWADYFDLTADYGELKRRFAEDEILQKACAYAGGIRILRQNSWEALSSFIISQNNNIPRIKGIISRLCEHFGGYPEISRLVGMTAEDLGFLRSGFRAKYLVDAVRKLSSNELSLEKISVLPLDDARAELMKIKGVGPKVADCTMLFGMHKLSAFPKDVWVKRVLERWYPNGLPECVKGFEGVAQQYLFHYIRSLDAG